MPSISVVTSVHNCSRYLPEAIESVLSQSFGDFEFLLVDDGSTDESAEIIQSYKDKRIRYIKNEENIGLTRSLNKAIELAYGKYIARFDGDDICMPDRLGEQYSFLENNPGTDLIGSDVIYIDNDGKRIMDGVTLRDHDTIVKALENKNVFFHPSILFKNDKDFRYREKFRYSQDYDFFLSLVLKGKQLGNINKKLLKYRVDPESISFSKTVEQQLFADKARLFYFQHKERGKDEYENFSPEEIRVQAQHKEQPKSVLKALIINTYKLNQFTSCKAYIRQYFQLYGRWNKYLIYYITIKLRLQKTARLLFDLKERLTRQ